MLPRPDEPSALLERIRPIAGAQGAAKAQIVGPQVRQRRYVGKAQRAGEAAEQAVHPGFAHERGQLRPGQMVPEAARLLVGRVEHDAEEPGCGQGCRQVQVRVLVGHQHGHQPQAFVR